LVLFEEHCWQNLRLHVRQIITTVLSWQISQVQKLVWELFDLKKDPKEMNNVYGDPAYANAVKKLKAELIRLRRKLEDDKDGIAISVGKI